MPINDNILIRQEKPSEFKAIYELVKIAFQTAKVSSGDEQDFVDRLRAPAEIIFLSLLLWLKEKILFLSAT